MKSTNQYDDFLRFIDSQGISLMPHQLSWAQVIYSNPIASGKTYLINILSEYEKYRIAQTGVTLEQQPIYSSNEDNAA